MNNKVIILSLPRCGSSIMANLVSSAGYETSINNNSELLGPSNFNKDGYFEDTQITLLNDQIIRMVYGMDYSFIHTPSLEDFKIKTEFPLNNPSFNYDLDESTVYTPKNYTDKIKEYSGCDWDVWGLTRMIEGEKWYKCYSKYEVSDFNSITKTLDKLVDIINNYPKNLVIKDPRLALTIPFYKFKDCKIIFIKRNRDESLASMQKHYGSNIFSTNYLPNTDYCSNHFNYKIKHQGFDYYYNTYNSIIKEYIHDKDSITVNYEDLLNRDETTINTINNYIQGNININLLKTK